MAYKKHKYIEHNGFKYKVTNRLYNIIINTLDEPDILHFLFNKYGPKWYQRMPNFGKKTMDEVLRLREEFLSSKDKTPKIKELSRMVLKISLPVEFQDIPTEKLILFKHDFSFANFNKNVERFSNKYDVLGKVDGYNYYQLLKTKGIGVNVIDPIWSWFKGLYISSFSEIVDYLSNSKPSIELKDIHHSFYLNNLFDKYKISSLDELSSLNDIQKDSLSFENKLALFELKTVYEDSDGNLRTRINHQTKTMNLHSFLDSYYNSLDDSSQDIMQKRWGNDTKSKLREVGESYGFTRERARQILQKLKSRFINEYFYDFNHIKRIIADIYIKKLSYLKIEDLDATHEYEKKLNDNFYKNFYCELFHPIPFYKSYRATSVNQTNNNLGIIMVTKRELKDISKIKLKTHLKRFDRYEQVELIKYIKNPFSTLDFKDGYIVQSEYRSSKWDDEFEKFKNFVNHHNRLPRADKRVKTTPKEELEIGYWIRKEKLKSKNGTLASDRFNQLNNVYPDFDKKQRSKKEPWIEKYKKYKDFLEKYRREPNQRGDIEGESPLGIWVSQNKQRYNGTSRNNSPLSDRQIELLNKINFDFSFSTRNNDLWEEHFKELRYIAPPNFSSTEIGSFLNRWVYYQKRAFKDGVLSKNKIAKLESIGINLSIGNRKQNWLKQLKEYLDLKNSNKLKSQTPVYNWFSRQGKAFQNNSLKIDQIIQLLLNDISLPIDRIESEWDNHYHSLKYFLSNEAKVLKKVMNKPNELYTWLIYNYCMYKLEKLSNERMAKFEKLDIEESIFDQ